MAEDDHAQSLEDSSRQTSAAPPVAAPASTQAPTSAPAPAPTADVVDHPPPAATPTTDVQLPSITSSTSVANETPALTSITSPSTVAAQTTPLASITPPSAASVVSSAKPQQNGNSGASEPDAKTEPNMSGQHSGLPQGQPMSYSSQSPQYPPAPGVSASQYASYPTVTSQPAPEAYRPNPVPVGSNAMSLPSMRTIDSMSQPAAPLGGVQHSLPTNLGMTPVQGGASYYGHHNLGVPVGYGLPSDTTMSRYALPHDPRLLGHRGPKKEIKRRTKTGCLTCRKRRIKCDETHPTCNNCKKSKRECLGYDPIFRQQPGNSSTTAIQPIQPAPSSQSIPPTTLPSTVPSSVPSSVPPSIASSVPSISSIPNSYGNQPSMLPSSYATSQASSSTPVQSNTAAPAYSPAQPSAQVNPTTKPEYQATAVDPAPQTLPSSTQSSSQDPSRIVGSSGSQYIKPKKMRIDEIIDTLGTTPPPQQIANTNETFNEIVKVYHEMYAPGLSSFFETGWYYFVENGQMTFPRDPQLVDRLGQFLKILEGVKANDQSQMASSGILETRIVWELARSSYSTPDASSAGFTGLPPDGDTKEARNRVKVVEALLCGDYLPTNLLTPPYQDVDPHRVRQFDFWYGLAEFVRSRNDPNSPAGIKAREDVLSRMRYLLDGRENRDLLYSIAIVRELAPRFDPKHASTLPQHLDETDPRHRLAVAAKFIVDESQTSGTTNVVRRFSDIASRAFVNPGVNINRIA